MQHLPQPASQPIQRLPPLPTAAWPAKQLAYPLLRDADERECLGDTVAETFTPHLTRSTPILPRLEVVWPRLA